MSHEIEPVKVLVFGVFDGLHAGHIFFLNEAKKLGNYLAVVVTPDSVVRKLKNKTPQYRLKERIARLQQSFAVDKILVGDSRVGSWAVFDKIKPDIIALGHDQSVLKEALEDHLQSSGLKSKIIEIIGFKTDTYKSSLLQNKNGQRL